MNLKEMKVIAMDIEEVKPYENNPRYNEKAVDYVANSIKEFGFRQPIVVDENNVIIVGHTRLLASKKLGLKKVLVAKADDLSPEKVKAYRLADNKTAEIAEWDNELLTIELEELENLDFDMTEFGFEDLEGPSEMLDIDDEEIGGPSATIEHKMKIDNFVIILTDEEYEEFMKRVKEYTEENGVTFGFVRELLWK